jgi:DNA methylase
VELIERALLNSSKAGDLVADLFGGSGSTLIACERRNRKARLMEIDPRYADCIVRRWQEYTGNRAALEGDGRSFEESAGAVEEGCMNSSLPPGNRGHRGTDPRRESGPAGPLSGAGRLECRATSAARPNKEKPPRRNPGGRRRRACYGSRLNGIGPRTVLTLGGFHCQTQLLADRARQVPTDRMRLPAGGFYQLIECGTVRPFQQVQDLRCFAALAGAFAILGRLRALRFFWLPFLAGVVFFSALALAGATRGFRGAVWAFVVAFGSEAESAGAA